MAAALTGCGKGQGFASASIPLKARSFGRESRLPERWLFSRRSLHPRKKVTSAAAHTDANGRFHLTTFAAGDARRKANTRWW